MSNLPESQLDEEVARLQKMLDAIREARQVTSGDLGNPATTPPPERAEKAWADDEDLFQWIGRTIGPIHISADTIFEVVFVILVVFFLARGG